MFLIIAFNLYKVSHIMRNMHIYFSYIMFSLYGNYCLCRNNPFLYNKKTEKHTFLFAKYKMVEKVIEEQYIKPVAH